MNKELKYVGKSIPIHDAKEKVTGKIKYVGDIRLAGMLYGKLLLSDVPHGKIIKIDTSKAEVLPGVVKVYTHLNTPATLYNSHKWTSGLKVVKDERMFTDHVRFVGDRVAVVVAKDRATAEEAVGLIEVEYEKLPVLVDPQEALKETSIKIHGGSNIISNREFKCGNPEDIFQSADFVVEDCVQTQKIHHAAMETHVCLASTEANGLITIWTPCQVVYQVQLITSEALQIPLSKIRVIKASMGGSFGGKGQPILEPICAFLSKETGAPVKLLMDRTESIIGTRTRNATIGKVKTAVSRDGEILARDIDVLVDAGAYFTNGEAVTIALGKKAFRLYRINHQSYQGKAVYTNSPIGGACRGYGSPQIHAITEIHMDNVARKIGMDPVEFRLKNLIHPFDDDLIGGPNLGNARAIDCVEKGKEAFGWKKRFNSPKQLGRYVRGVGMACGVHGNGYYGAYQDFITMDLRMTEDGELFLKSGIHDLGCGTVTTIKQIVAEVWDINVDKITALEGDTLVSPYDSAGTQASRVTFVCGECARITAELLKEKFLNYAAEIFNTHVENVEIENEKIWCKDDVNKQYSYSKMVLEIRKRFKDDSSLKYTYAAKANPAVYTANFVEVEVDTLTGLTKVLDVLAVHDIGKAINPGFVEGQVQGSIQMGIGFALTEEIMIDQQGKIKGDAFSKYHIINAPDMPPVKVVLVEEGEEHGPFGAKSVGEVATIAIAPAIVNAINHALDVNITSLPVTPEKIVEALNNK